VQPIADDSIHAPPRLRLWQGRILRACLTESRDAGHALVRAAPEETLDSLPAVAEFHRAVGLVYDCVGRELPAGPAGRLERVYRAERARHLIVVANLRRVGELMDSAGIAFLVVKGPVLAELVYRRPRLRFYRDLDLIVPRRSFPAALQAFESEGAEVIDPNWRYLFDQVAGELELTTGIDLHWHFLFSENVRRTTNIRMEEVFERARRTSVGGVSVLTPDAPDTLIHLALHACKEGGGRLIWLKDIEQAVVNDRPPWNEVVERALDWRVNLFVGAMLIRARVAIRAPVPDEVLEALIPRRAWRGVLRSLDRLFPVGVWSGRETPATIAVRATREDVGATVAFLASGALRRARGSVGPRSKRRSAGPRAGETALVSEPRRAFLERIASDR
jgi:hypothetical protein